MTPLSTPRSSTPNPATDAQNQERAADEDKLLHYFAVAMQEIGQMEKQVMNLWRQEISALLPEPESADNNAEDPEGSALDYSISPVISLILCYSYYPVYPL